MVVLFLSSLSKGEWQVPPTKLDINIYVEERMLAHGDFSPKSEWQDMLKTIQGARDASGQLNKLQSYFRHIITCLQGITF